MNRLYVHVSVDDFDGSLAFYRALFGFAPTTVGDDCAEWLLDDPALDFALSRRTGGEPVLTRLGLQMESVEDLAALRARLADVGPAAAGEQAPDDGVDKHWMVDPVGVLWEAYHLTGARLASAPSNADYIAARQRSAAAEAAHCEATVRYRRLQRRQQGYVRRPEARM